MKEIELIQALQEIISFSYAKGRYLHCLDNAKKEVQCRKEIEKREKKILKEFERLKKLINCVKDHPEIKPINCCYQADTIMLKELKKEQHFRILFSAMTSDISKTMDLHKQKGKILKKELRKLKRGLKNENRKNN